MCIALKCCYLCTGTYDFCSISLMLLQLLWVKLGQQKINVCQLLEKNVLQVGRGFSHSTDNFKHTNIGNNSLQSNFKHARDKAHFYTILNINPLTVSP